jgi:hypothetical protein
LHYNYKKLLLDYPARAQEYIDMNLGYIAGGISHLWHGKKANRKYQDRWQILVKNSYDPLVDIKRDSQGLVKLDCGWELRNDIQAYFRVRNEDSRDVG